MVSLIVKHKVADYDRWHNVFTSLDAERTAQGCTAARVSRFVDDPSIVVVTQDWPTVDAAKAYAASPRLREAMSTAGVLEKPVIYLVEDTEA